MRRGALRAPVAVVLGLTVAPAPAPAAAPRLLRAEPVPPALAFPYREGATTLVLGHAQAPERTLLAVHTDARRFPPGQPPRQCYAFGRVVSIREDRRPITRGCVPSRGIDVRSQVDLADTLTPAEYRERRRTRRPLTGTTVVAGRVRAGVRRVVVDGPGRARTVATDPSGAFLVGFDRTLEATRVVVRARMPGGTRRSVSFRYGRARLVPYDLGEFVGRPSVTRRIP